MAPSNINEACAEELFEIVPPVMQFLRLEMRAAVKGHLTIAQFRVLARVRKSGAGISLGEAAEWIGISLPAMSRMVDGLVRRGYIKRVRLPADRRQARLTLTSSGKKFYAQMKNKAQTSLAAKLSERSLKQRTMLMASLRGLRDSLFSLEDIHEVGAPYIAGAGSGLRLRS